MQTIKTHQQALEYLYRYIPHGMKYKFPGDLGLRRTKYLLKLLGEPQNQLKVIHIAGTSGKTSTVYFTSVILKSLGFRVGLNVSPHFEDIRERFQINNKLIDEKDFCKYLAEMIPSIERMRETQYGLPTYFEITVALAYYIFFRERVDYAVIETGLGGLYDASNVVERKNKIAIITTIGHDHTYILGNTLKKIAYQKAGIIQPHNVVITPQQHSNALRVIQKESKKNESTLYLINDTNTLNKSLIPLPKFDFHFLHTSIKNIELRMMGSHQITNCSLALATTVFLSKRDKFFLDKEKIRLELKNALYPGRMQVFTFSKKKVILDGAHNPQKMGMFIKNLKIYFPNQKFSFLVAFKKGKDYKKILKYITLLAGKIIITTFFNQQKQQGLHILSEDTKNISSILDELDFKNYVICKDTFKALDLLLKTKEKTSVITGSLYLLSEAYPKLKVNYHLS